MGYGSYSYDAHQALTRSRQGLSADAVFTQTVMHPAMDPKGVRFRESRDSEAHPDSLGIVFALDISGSMAQIPVSIACEQLPGFMKLLEDCRVADPQVLFMAFTDLQGDGRPLQVGQFETTAELMDQWLTRCSLKGGGNELYELAMHFAAHHTAMDCWERRQKKGYFFITGDEPTSETLSAAVVERFLGTSIQDQPLEAVVEDLKKTYEPFFLIPDRSRGSRIADFWRRYLGDRTIVLESPDDTCGAAAGLVALGEGTVSDLSELQARLVAAGTSKARAGAIAGALKPWAESSERGR
ncbi:MAG: VWA domain-containing protein [Deltaproteobacteria bacterium]|nr:VWA domain-containing protein [Deltaproteobacteria bacterium]